MSARENWNPWSVTLAALVIAALLLAFGRGHPGHVSDSMSFAITVVPADSVNLDCSSDQRFGDVHCAYDGEGRPMPGANPLRPYVTVGRELILLSGVFEEPRVSHWLSQARAAGANERVTLDCKASMLGKLPQVAVRWQIGAAWGKEHEVPVAKIQSCTVGR
jgi:hypothetical protein